MKKQIILTTLILGCLFVKGQEDTSAFRRADNTWKKGTGTTLEVKNPKPFITEGITTTTPTLNILLGKNVFKDSFSHEIGKSELGNAITSTMAVGKPPLIIDTIPCIILVSDTGVNHESNVAIGQYAEVYNNHVYYIYGYYIRRSDYVGSRPLDADKKPLPKSIIVWESIEIK